MICDQCNQAIFNVTTHLRDGCPALEDPEAYEVPKQQDEAVMIYVVIHTLDNRVHSASAHSQSLEAGKKACESVLALDNELRDSRQTSVPSPNITPEREPEEIVSEVEDDGYCIVLSGPTHRIEVIELSIP